jgi:hypothetical protein
LVLFLKELGYSEEVIATLSKDGIIRKVGGHRGKSTELPRISFEDGKRRIVIHITKGEELLNSRPIGDTKFRSWSTGASETIKRTLGAKSDWLSTFNGQLPISLMIDELALLARTRATNRAGMLKGNPSQTGT